MPEMALTGEIIVAERVDWATVSAVTMRIRHRMERRRRCGQNAVD